MHILKTKQNRTKTKKLVNVALFINYSNRICNCFRYLNCSVKYLIEYLSYYSNFTFVSNRISTSNLRIVCDHIIFISSVFIIWIEKTFRLSVELLIWLVNQQKLFVSWRDRRWIHQMVNNESFAATGLFSSFHLLYLLLRYVFFYFYLFYLHILPYITILSFFKNILNCSLKYFFFCS